MRTTLAQRLANFERRMSNVFSEHLYSEPIIRAEGLAVDKTPGLLASLTSSILCVTQYMSHVQFNSFIFLTLLWQIQYV